MLRHQAEDSEKPKDVTTLDWNHDGSLLASGSYDGMARVWTREGERCLVLHAHAAALHVAVAAATGGSVCFGPLFAAADRALACRRLATQQFALSRCQRSAVTCM